MILFTICLGLMVPAILLMERRVQPRMDGKRPIFYRVSLLAAMPSVVFYVTIFMISYRPILSIGVTIIAFAAIVIVNNAKFASLKEPLVFSDFALLRQAIAHPVLYVHYIGIWNIIIVGSLVVVTVVGASIFETSVIPRNVLDDYFPTAAYLFVVFGMIYAVTRGPLRSAFAKFLYRFGSETDVRRDVERLSLVVCLIFYFFLSNAPKVSSPLTVINPITPTTDNPLPAVVLVQNESFFDLRRVHPSIQESILANWDKVAAVSAYSGRLSVPAWGANTMRTEFEVLSGMPAESLGPHRFNPYLSLAKRPIWTLAHQLRSLGYRTVCVHPFPSSFFDRDQVFPNLGFDTFIDIEDFSEAEKFGPYISDLAVADKILDVLDGDDGPVFVFAITMENHGKWQPGRLDGWVTPEELKEAYPLGSQELALYQRHLANADAMLARLIDGLEPRSEGAVLSMYGDHVPSLPGVFQAAGYTDDRTEYLVWRTGRPRLHTVDIPANNLGRLVLEATLDQSGHEETATNGIGRKAAS